MKSRPNWLVLFLLYLVLWTFACAYPLLDLLSQNSEFFVVRRSGPGEIYLLVIALISIVPIVLSVLDLAFSALFNPIGVFFRFVCFAVLAMATSLIFLNRIPLEPGLLAASVGAIAGILVALGIIRSQAFRGFVFWLSPIVILSPATFFLSANVRSLVTVQEEGVGLQAGESASNTPVVMVILDEFPLWALLARDLKVDAVRFPNFAKFAAQAHWFRNATAVNQFTPLAVPAILSGRFPESSSTLPTFQNYPGSIFTLLQNSHQMQVLEPITQLCPRRLCGRNSISEEPKQSLKALSMDLLAIYLRSVVPEDIDLGHPEIDGKWRDFWAGGAQDDWDMPEFSRDERIRGFENYISTLSKGERPSLYFSHHILPHMPLQFLPSGRSYSIRGTRGYVKNRWLDNKAAIQSGLRQYLLQLGAVDTLVGRLFSRLDELGIYDDALIIVTADHGLSFQPNTYRRGDAALPAFYEDILSVPLFIKLPNQKEGALSDRNVEAIDILPTIADLLKIKMNFPVDGVSVFGGPEREKKKVLIGRIPGAKARADMNEDQIKQTGKVITIDPPKIFPTGSLQSKLSIPGYESPPQSDPFYLGTHSDLVGAKIENQRRLKSSQLKIQMNEKRWQQNEKVTIKWDNKSAVCPCRIQGRLIGGADILNSTVALAVNGVIAGFATPYRRGSETNEIEFFIPEKALKDGENEITHWLVEVDPNDQGLNFAEILPTQPVR